MATVVLFHSALGLRPAVETFAEQLRTAGHVVHTPDLYDGEVFDDLDAGVAKRDAVGIAELMGRANEAVAELPAELVYAGFSMGAAAAQMLGATRPGARGVILIQGAVPLEALGVATWPATVPVQLHATSEDPWFDAQVVADLAAAVPDHLVDVHVYDSDGHLVSDDAWADHDPFIAERIHTEVLAWLARRDEAPRRPRQRPVSWRVR